MAGSRVRGQRLTLAASGVLIAFLAVAVVVTNGAHRTDQTIAAGATPTTAPISTPTTEVTTSEPDVTTPTPDTTSPDVLASVLSNVGAGGTKPPWWQTGGGSIGNRVWHDLNRDGVQDPGEPGMADVEILLLDGEGGELLASGRTDDKGWWGYTNLAPADQAGAPNTFRIRVVAPPGFMPTNLRAGGDDNTDSDVSESGELIGAGIPVSEQVDGKSVPLHHENIDIGLIG